MRDSPGLMRRRQEYATLREAAGDGSTQARLRLDTAKRALARQEAVSRTRRILDRVRGR